LYGACTDIPRPSYGSFPSLVRTTHGHSPYVRYGTPPSATEMMEFILGRTDSSSLNLPIYIIYRPGVRCENGLLITPEHHDAARNIPTIDPCIALKTPEPRQKGKSEPEDKSPPPPNRKRCAIATCHFHAGQTPDQDWSNRLLALPLDKFSSLQRGESEVEPRRRIKLLGEKIK